MPIVPHAIDVNAPITNANDIYADLNCSTAPKIMKNIITTNAMHTKYSCFKNS